MLKKWATLWQWISLVALLQILSGHGAAMAQADCVGGSWLNQRTGQNVRAGLGLPEPGTPVVYSDQDQNGKLILPKCAYAVGNVTIPVFMVNWADFDPQTSLSNENNPQSTLPAGYVRSTPQELGSYLQANLTDYWRNVTGGRLNLSFDTYGWLDSSTPGAYLKSRQSYLFNSAASGSPPHWYCDRNAMFKDVIKDAATRHGLDLGRYDLDGNGVVDGAVLVYAGGAGLCNGTNLSWINSLYTPNPASFNWQSTLPDLFDAVDPNRAQFANQTQILHLYNNIPERERFTPDQFTNIGTWAHELGHMLWNFPDLYYNRFNIGVWALSASEGAIPSHPAAFEKWMYGHLITPTDISTNGSYVLQANEIADGSDHNQGTYLYRIPLDTPSHFLTVEARWFDADGNTGTRWATARGRESGLVILEHRHDTSYFGGTPVMLYRYVPERDGSENSLRDQNAAFKPGDVFQRCLFEQCITITPTTGPGAAFGFDLNIAPVDPQVLASTGLRFLRPAQPTHFILNSSEKIRWSGLLDASDTIKIELSRDGGSTWETVAASVANTGLYNWQVSGAASDAVKLRLTSNSKPSVSVTSSVSRILVPAMSWLTPGSNLIMQPGNLLPLRWNSNLPTTDHASVDISRDGGSTWSTLFGSVQNNGAFDWYISGNMGEQLRFRINSAYYPGVGATSAIVTLAPPPVGVTSPNSNVNWFEGNTQSITWNSSFFASENVTIEFSRDSGSTWQVINSGTANNGRYDWQVAGTTNNGKIRISASNNPANVDASDVDFRVIAPTLSLSQPNQAGYSWTVGTSLFIAWSNNFSKTATLKVELSRDDGATWSVLTHAAPNANSYNVQGYSWTVDGSATSTARIRITSNDFPALSVTGAPFTIFVPTLSVTSQASSGSYAIGSLLPITWNSNLLSSTNVKIEFSGDDGSTWRTLYASYPNTGNWTWRIDGTPTANGRIRVSSLSSTAQDVSHASITLFTPQISVTAPTGGANWVLGERQTIRWSSNLPSTASVAVDLSRDGGSTWEKLAVAITNSGSFSWTVAGASSNNVLARISLNETYTLRAVSPAAFAIVPQSLSLTSPNGGEIWPLSGNRTITWNSNFPASSIVTLELSRDAGATWQLISGGTANTGSFNWRVSGVSSNARIRVASASNPAVFDISDADFSVYSPDLSLVPPAAGANWLIGSSQTLNWISNLPTGISIKIELSRDNGSTWETLAAAAPNTGSFNWQVTGPTTSGARVRISPNDNFVAISSSVQPFNIVAPSISVSAPVGAVSWIIGQPQTITWSSNLPGSALMQIDLSRDGGTSWETLASAAPNSGSFNWTVAGSASTSVQVRVSNNGTAASGANPGGNFAILAPTLALNAPASAVNWAVGTTQSIRWGSNLPSSSTVRIELSRDGGASWGTVVASTANSGSYDWQVGGSATSAARLRIASNEYAASIESVNFALFVPGITVTSVNSSASLASGTSQTITWSSTLPASALVKIEFSSNGGSTWSLITGSTANSGSFAWTVPAQVTGSARLRVSSLDYASASDVNDANFAIVAPRVTVTAPNSAVTWTIGSLRSITWSHNLGSAAKWNIEISRNKGSTWSSIATGVASSSTSAGSYTWTTTGSAATNSCLIRITAVGNSTVKDVSDVAFTIK